MGVVLMFKLNPWPYAVAALIAFGAGVISGGMAYRQIVAPGDIAAAVAAEQKIQQEICLSDVTLAGAAAQEAARLRFRNATEQAIAVERKRAVAREAARVAEIEQLEMENAKYAQILVDAGRSCPLDADIARWLRGERSAAN